MKNSNNLIENIIEASKKYENKIAIISKNKSLTYGKMLREGYLISNSLNINSKNKENVIGVILEKSCEQIVSILGIILSQRAYLPISLSWPESYIERVLRRSKIDTIITKKNLNVNISKNLKKIFIEQIDNSISKNAFYNANKIDPTSSAYVIFTSGSTGTPKGVEMAHKSVANTINNINDRFNVSDNDTIFALSSLNFDLSVYDVFGLLGSGGTIVLPLKNEVTNPNSWIGYFLKNKITIWNSVPALMQLFVEQIESDMDDNFTYNSLRLILLSGDWIPIDLPKKIKKIFPNANIVSLGGATECSIWSVLYEIKNINPEWESIPYGKAMKNQTIYVYDSELKKCLPDQIGEIYIGGQGLAKGYFYDEIGTKSAFFTHPVTNERIYRTGDHGCYFKDWNIKFLGRKDNQIKINGFRVELKEIEKLILKHPKIKNAIVIDNKTKNGAHQILAGIISESLNLKEIEHYLNLSLPKYMIPHITKILKNFSLTTNGKVDITLIRKNILDNDKIAKNIKFTSQEFEKMPNNLLKIFEEVLFIKNIDIYDDFKFLGLTSLAAIRIVNRINNFSNKKFGPEILIKYSTISKLNSYLNDFKNNNQKEELDLLNLNNVSTSNNPPLFFIHPVGGTVFCYFELAKLLNLPCYGICYSEKVETIFKKESSYLENLANIYKNQILKKYPQENYNLLGWSFGGLLGYEIARQLEKDGKRVSNLFIIDSASPDQYGLKDKNQEKVVLEYYIKEVGKLFKELPKLKIDFNQMPFAIMNQICLQARKMNESNSNINFYEIKKLTNHFKLFLMLGKRYKLLDNIEKINYIVAKDGERMNYLHKWEKHSRQKMELSLITGGHFDVFANNNLHALSKYLNKSLIRKEK